MAARARAGNLATMARDYERQAQEAEARATVIRRTLMTDDPVADAGPPHAPHPKWDGRLYGSAGSGAGETPSKRSRARKTGRAKNGSGGTSPTRPKGRGRKG